MHYFPSSAVCPSTIHCVTAIGAFVYVSWCFHRHSIHYSPARCKAAPRLKLGLHELGTRRPRRLLHSYPARWPEQSRVQGLPRKLSSSSCSSSEVFRRPAQWARWLNPRGRSQLMLRRYFSDHFSETNSRARMWMPRDPSGSVNSISESAKVKHRAGDAVISWARDCCAAAGADPAARGCWELYWVAPTCF